LDNIVRTGFASLGALPQTAVGATLPTWEFRGASPLLS